MLKILEDIGTEDIGLVIPNQGLQWRQVEFEALTEYIAASSCVTFVSSTLFYSLCLKRKSQVAYLNDFLFKWIWF